MLPSGQFLQRKFVDLVYKLSSKWVNWDPPIEIKVGAYGTVDRNTGDFVQHGNIYDAEFQQELDKYGININLADHPPKQGPPEDDFTINSCGAKRRDVNMDNQAGVAGAANVSVKGQWSYECGKQEAVLIMHRPRLVFLPTNVILEHLYKVDKLIDKYLVTAVHVCPAYSMYLSEKKGDKVSLSLVAQSPVADAVGANANVNDGFSWAADMQGGFLRKACDKAGNYVYMPLFALKRPIRRYRFFRGEETDERTGDDLWYTPSPPWDPLNEDGEEEAFSPTVSRANPFADP